MKRTQLLQENRKMRFIEVYGEWNAGRLTQAEAGLVLGMCARCQVSLFALFVNATAGLTAGSIATIGRS